MLAERLETCKTLDDFYRDSFYTRKYKTEKEYKQEYDFLKEVDAFALQQARLNLEKEYIKIQKSFKGLRPGKTTGFPRFKSKHNHNDSYRTGMAVAVNFEGQTVKLPKIKEPVKFKHRVNIKSWYRAAELKNITVSRSPAGKYYASCLFEGEQDFLGFQEKAEKVMGLDVPLRDFYADALENNPEYRRVRGKSEKALAKYQRRLSRKPKDSRNREKARIKVARVQDRMGNFRRNFIDTLSCALVQSYDVIVVESLSLKGMPQAARGGIPVMDSGFSSFVSKLQYKALWQDKTMLVADKWFARVLKRVMHGGYVKNDAPAREREWTLPERRTPYTRDMNAAAHLAELDKTIPAQRGECGRGRGRKSGQPETSETSVDTGSLALGNKGETAVETPETGRSRNLEEQASKEAQASSPCQKAVGC
jgi:putative transposase